MSLKETLAKHGLESVEQILDHFKLSGLSRQATRRSLYNWADSYPNLLEAVAAGVANPTGIYFDTPKQRIKATGKIKRVQDVAEFIGREYQLIRTWNNSRHELLEAIIDGVEHIKSEE